jgi:hypothetical protein
VERSFHFIVNLQWFQANSRRKPFADYVRNPQLLALDFADLSEKLAADAPFRQSLYSTEITFEYLTQDFDFETFLALRRDLSQFDAEISTTLSSRSEEISRVWLDVIVHRSASTEASLFAQLQSALQSQNVVNRLMSAFKQRNPLGKLRQARKALAELKKLLLENLRPSVSIGADDIWPLTLAFIALVNPPILLSNCVFLHDFLDSEVYGSIHDDVVQVVSKLAEVARVVLRRDPETFYRLADRR